MTFPVARTLALGVVIPVHNEEELLGGALSSLTESFSALRGLRLELRVAVVLDDCQDASADIVGQWVARLRRDGNSLSVCVISCSANNVGAARGMGCTTLLHEWSDLDPARIWLATTDGDSRVPRNWLSAQLDHHESGVDLWSGRVSVEDWSLHSSETSAAWRREYEAEEYPIHGASLGFNAKAYIAAGGFDPSRTGEDRALYAAISKGGAVPHHERAIRVTTSSRRIARAPLGFGHALNLIERSVRRAVPVESTTQRIHEFFGT